MFKQRYYKHNESFRVAGKRNVTRLFKYMWELKDQGIDIEGIIKWDIEYKSVPYKCGTRRCDLCTSEKLAILLADNRILLNKRSEIISMCRHRAKFKSTQVR